jgi:hypothetical protein
MPTAVWCVIRPKAWPARVWSGQGRRVRSGVRTCVYHGGDEAKLGLVRSGLDECSDTERGRSRNTAVQQAGRGMRLGSEQGREGQGGGGMRRQCGEQASGVTSVPERRLVAAGKVFG